MCSATLLLPWRVLSLMSGSGSVSRRWTMFTGDDSESGLYSPGDEAPAGSENSQRVLDGSSQLGYRCGAPLTLLLRVNVFYFYVRTLEHHARNCILPSVVDRYLPLSAVLLFDINETRFFSAEYYGIYSSIDKR